MLFFYLNSHVSLTWLSLVWPTCKWWTSAGFAILSSLVFHLEFLLWSSHGWKNFLNSIYRYSDGSGLFTELPVHTVKLCKTRQLCSWEHQEVLKSLFPLPKLESPFSTQKAKGNIFEFLVAFGVFFLLLLLFLDHILVCIWPKLAI